MLQQYREPILAYDRFEIAALFFLDTFFKVASPTQGVVDGIGDLIRPELNGFRHVVINEPSFTSLLDKAP